MADSLVFDMVPRGERLTFRAMVSVTDSINRILRDVEYGLTGSKHARDWVVTELTTQVPSVRIRPMLDEAGLVDATAHGIQVITSEQALAGPPNGWTEFALNDLREMRKLFNKRRRGYEMRQVDVRTDDRSIGRISDDISRKVDRVYSGGHYLLGSLEGDLEAVNLHGRAHITIWERVSRKPVKVYLNDAVREKAKSLLERRVLAVGRINYYANGLPRSIVDVTDILDLERPSHRLTAEFGSIPDLTGNKSTEEFLKALRE